MKTAARFLTRATIAAGIALASGCAWVGLGWGALTYPTTRAGEAANVVVSGNYAYVTRGGAGIEILRLGSGARSERVSLPAGLDSADDLAVADGLLFVLDARPPGHLGVFSLADPAAPRPLGTPVAVEVGPFSGVSAAAGRVIVSGGTSQLSLRRYDASGVLASDVARADFGRGQPDVLLAPSGELAVVSTHDWGPRFGLTLVRTADAGAVTALGTLALETYGFTPGGARPASFPIETALDGTTAYVASAGGLGIVDVADPAAPRLLATLEPGVQPVNVDARGGIVAVVGSSPRPMLVLVDARVRAQPKVLQSFPLPEGSRATGVALTPSQVVVAAHERGALLLDRSGGVWEHVSQPSPKTFLQGATP